MDPNKLPKGQYDPGPHLRIYLNVPFKDKEEAKELNCRWDLEIKSWYCVDNDYNDVEECITRWGRKTYKIINGKKKSLMNIDD